VRIDLGQESSSGSLRRIGFHCLVHCSFGNGAGPRPVLLPPSTGSGSGFSGPE
jgi:hypothetical protein